MITSSVAKITQAYAVAEITLKVVGGHLFSCQYHVVVDNQRLKWLSSFFSVVKIIFVVAAMNFKVAVSSSVAMIIFEVAEITFKVASVTDISLLAKITFVVSEIIIKDNVTPF